MAKFSYVKGQRTPQTVLNATPTNGQSPLTVQFSSDAGGIGIAELRQDAVDGPLVGSFTIPGTEGTTTYASHTVSLTPPAGLRDLFLVFRQAPGGPGNNFFNLNWVEFGGAGVGT